MHRPRPAALVPLLVGLAACVVEPADTMEPFFVEPGESFTLSVGQTARLTGVDLVIRLVEVARDSRCPRDVVCVWEGDAVAAIEVTYRGFERAFGLHVNPGGATGPGAAEVGGYRIELEAVSPEPLAGTTIPQGEYRVTLQVGPGSSPT